MTLFPSFGRHSPAPLSMTGVLFHRSLDTITQYSTVERGSLLRFVFPWDTRPYLYLSDTDATFHPGHQDSTPVTVCYVGTDLEYYQRLQRSLTRFAIRCGHQCAILHPPTS